MYFQQEVQAPLLVMEFLSKNLASYLEEQSQLPQEISYSILHDVALGLYHLHSQTPPIIHRDLTANNILLASNMTAKISDLGVAKILNLTPLQRSRMTQTPGTPVYMPPEVMIANPKYNTSVDEFSYGILMIHVFSGKWPEPQVGQTLIEADKLIPVTEAERREVFLQTIGNDHPLTNLILRCISNDPKHRAHASEIVDQLTEMVVKFPAPFIDQLEMLKHIEAQEEEKRALREEVEKMAREVEQKSEEILHLKEEIKAKELFHSSGMEQLRLQVDSLNADKSLHKSTYSLLEEELANVVSVKESAILRKQSEIETKTRILKRKDVIISKMDEQLTRAREYLATKQQVSGPQSHCMCMFKAHILLHVRGR